MTDYKHFEKQRADYSQKVIDSNSSKRLVMAGPGTGKSYLFQQIAKDLIANGKTNILVLTFINELVKDLAVDMHGLADVSTLHSFATKQLANRQNIYLDLLNVIEADLYAEKSTKVNISSILNNLTSGEEETISYASKRRNYYKSYDPTSIVFELVNLYLNDSSKIPEYNLILVDEYQDFNELEAKLIELLSTKSSVLIAGDDDQSLYSFKHSKPANIREMYNSGDYETFELPYCSRSTSVVIDAFHDFVNNAKSNGYLSSRIDKQYLYFPEEKKDKVSGIHSRIDSKKKIFEGQNSFYIDKAIKEIFKNEPKFDVLIICSLKRQIKPLADALRKRGYNNISGDESSNNKKDKLIQGITFLLDDKESNLGWRLSAEGLMGADDLYEAINKSADCQLPFIKCLPSDTISVVKKLRAIVVKLDKNTDLTDEEHDLLFSQLSIDPIKLAEENVRELIFSKSSSGGVHNSVRIKITTILGSKGLSYDYVFMVNFDNRYLIPSTGIDDESINKFLVALTRSRKKVHIYTGQLHESTFVSWIDDSRKNQY